MLYDGSKQFTTIVYFYYILVQDVFEPVLVGKKRFLGKRSTTTAQHQQMNYMVPV